MRMIQTPFYGVLGAQVEHQVSFKFFSRNLFLGGGVIIFYCNLLFLFPHSYNTGQWGAGNGDKIPVNSGVDLASDLCAYYVTRLLTFPHLHLSPTSNLWLSIFQPPPPPPPPLLLWRESDEFSMKWWMKIKWPMSMIHINIMNNALYILFSLALADHGTVLFFFFF